MGSFTLFKYEIVIMSKKLAKTMMTLIIFFAFSERAIALKCGHRIIDIGANKAKVISRCGQPVFAEVREKVFPLHCIDRFGRVDGDDLLYGYGRYPRCQTDTFEVWTYDFGRRQFMRELIFRNGVLHKIVLLDYYGN